MLKALVTTATLVVLMGTAAGTAMASHTPCWKVVVSDWYADGRVDGTYPTVCYEQAIRNLPGDVKAYADAADEIQRAMLAAQRRGGATKEDGTVSGDGKKGHDARPLAFGDSSGGGGDPPKGFLSSLIDRVGPKNAGSIPLPLLVLAGIAFLLLAAAAASFVARRLQARRVVPAPAPAPRPHERG
jgi:hypothetical protein